MPQSTDLFLTRKKMTPTKTFKMPKRIKTLLASLPFTDIDQRHAFARLMIQSHLASEVKPTREKEREDK